jgi:hypothetical protein
MVESPLGNDGVTTVAMMAARTSPSSRYEYR